MTAMAPADAACQATGPQFFASFTSLCALSLSVRVTEISCGKVKEYRKGLAKGIAPSPGPGYMILSISLLAAPPLGLGLQLEQGALTCEGKRQAKEGYIYSVVASRGFMACLRSRRLWPGQRAPVVRAV
jgi:hypothetical protein